jgi:serine/threonine-protein kinase
VFLFDRWAGTGIATHLAAVGEVFAVFDRHDSGCVSFGVAAGGRRWFVKAAHGPRSIAGLRRAAHLHRSVAHPALAPFHGEIELEDGTVALVYDWVPGEVLYDPAAADGVPRGHPGSAHARFRTMPVAHIVSALDAVFALHLSLAAAGFIAVDFYDGCLLYDFDEHRMRVVDLDEYRSGPFRNPSDRLPGSTRFMAPEEFVRGARIDGVTNVFTLGRCAGVLLDDPPPALVTVIDRATRPDRAGRYPSVAAFVAAWGSAAARSH